jgi:hypothetical protein
MLAYLFSKINLIFAQILQKNNNIIFDIVKKSKFNTTTTKIAVLVQIFVNSSMKINLVY